MIRELHSPQNLAGHQTTAPKVTRSLAPSDIRPVQDFHVLADSARDLYFSKCLVDAAEHVGGGLAGLETVEALLRHENPY